MSGPFDGEQPQEPGHPPHPQQPWQPPFQRPPFQPPSQPFVQPPVQQFPQPVPWRPVEPLPQPPLQPHADRSFSSARGLGTAVSILICLVALGEALFAASDWYTYRVVTDYLEGPVKDPDRLDRADLIAGVVAGGFLLVLLAAGVLFIVWLWRVRRNAELFCAGRHRRSRGWVIGGWFCPVVNFWFPKQIVDDVIAASDPRTPPRVPDLRGIPRNGLVLAWWITWVASLVTGNLGGTDWAADVPDVDDLVTGASLSTISAVVTAVCAVLASRVIHLVNRIQVSRPWIAWWATDPWAAPAGQPYSPVPPWAAQ
jgi:Domain of unknown function (DUF4328)